MARALAGNLPYLVFDARREKVRHAGQLRDCAVLIALGIGPDGKRALLGVSVALSEAEVHWRDFLKSLVARGLCGVGFIVSDDHPGMAAARKAVFGAVPWQRCQFRLQQKRPGLRPAAGATGRSRPRHPQRLRRFQPPRRRTVPQGNRRPLRPERPQTGP